MAVAYLPPFAPSQIALLLATRSMLLRHENVSLAVGFRRIHTPEHVASTHPFTLPYFKIIPNTTTQPIIHQGASLIAFDFEIGLMPARFSARMFTTNPQECHVLVMDMLHRPCFFTKMTVAPLGANGHTLRVDTLPYMHTNWLTRMLAPVWRRFLWWETETLRDRNKGELENNFIAYRAMFPKRLAKILNHL